MAFPRTSSKALRAGRIAESQITNSYESMRRSSRSTSLFSFVLRHSLIVIRLVTTRVVRLKLFRLKAEGVQKERLPQFGGETADFRIKHAFKVCGIPAFPNSLQPIHLSSYDNGFVCVSRGFANAKGAFAQNRSTYFLDRGIAFLKKRLKQLYLNRRNDAFGDI